MKNKVINGIFFLILAALIIGFGVVIPRIMLSGQEKQLLQSSGNLKAENFDVYGNDEISAKVFAWRITGLSDMVIRLIKEGDVSERMLIDDRGPLDTELSQKEAVSGAQSFLGEMRAVFAEYGYSYFHDIPAVDSKGAGKDTDQWEDFRAELITSSDDASLSLWRINLGNYVVVMDAVSGVPLDISGNISDTDVPFPKCKPYGLLWTVAARVYNSSYKLGNDLAFSPKSNTFLGDTGKIYRWSGQGEFYNLEADYLQSGEDGRPAFHIQLFT